MANRAAFEIDLPVEELKSFISDYKAFKALLAEQPSEWAAVGDSISDLLDPIDKIIGAVAGIGAAQTEAIQGSAAMVELVQRRQQMTEAQTNLILLQRVDLEERIARRRLEQQRKDDAAAKGQKSGADIFAATASKSAKLFSQIDNATARTFLRLKDSTLELLKWGGILTGVGTLLGGLAGAGGLFGMSRLANAVMDRSRSAAGMNVTYGEAQAFSTDYQNLLDSPEGVLGGLANAQNDPRVGRALTALGISAADQKKDPAQLAPEVIAAVRALYRQDPANYAMISQAYGVDQLGFTEADARRLAAETPQQLAQTAQQFQTDAKTMNLPAGVQQEWTDLAKALDRAKTALETDLIGALTPLAPVLEQLSGDLIAVVADLLQEPEVKQGLQDVDNWLKGFSAYLKSDQFQKQLKTWEADFVKTLDDIKAVLGDYDKMLHPGGVKGHWDGLPGLSTYVPDSKDPKELEKIPFYELTPDQIWQLLLGKKYDMPGNASPDASPQQSPLFQLQSFEPFAAPAPVIIQAAYAPSPGAPPLISSADYEPFAYGPPAPGQVAVPGAYAGGSGGFGAPGSFGGLEGEYGLPPGLLARVRQVESGGNDDAVSAAGAEGPFQFLPSTASQYGVSDPFDLAEAAPAAAKMFRDLLGEFHGDLREAVAAYNWGAGNVKNDVATYGADWESHLPQETQGYLEKVLSGAAGRNPPPARQPAQVKIDVSNRTGGSAIITTKVIAI
jgi:hypothetical protein